jgi:hypothetical protein
LRGELSFYLGNCGGDLFIDLRADAWRAEEELVGSFAEEGVGEGEGAENAMAAEEVERSAEVA